MASRVDSSWRSGLVLGRWIGGACRTICCVVIGLLWLVMALVLVILILLTSLIPGSRAWTTIDDPCAGRQTVKIFLLDTATPAQIQAVKSAVRAVDPEAAMNYISKAQALELAKQQFRDEPEVMDGLPGNPFPASLVVTLGSADDGALAQDVQKLPGVKEARVNGCVESNGSDSTAYETDTFQDAG